ncbi:pyridoxal phosphate-dependent aminotransferase [Desulfonatronospira sp.]|uniref:pyridoxal phosphate-dependent aminotransferase n=1 Tax=Desulfonatronospira sp. TaxID=1962951 RepID=UPI0025C208C2|nr:pyridoxal phosphate-dependent aminotransferase [Desulfonatronospira sp.]
MSVLNPQVADYLEKASWIRRMFEAGSELKQKYGPENVFDFSLGNPDLPPPPEVGQALEELGRNADRPYALGYMPNAGLPGVRKALAGVVSKEQQVKLADENIVVTCGAAGGINVFFRAVLRPGDEVVCPAPFFVEYSFYTQNFQGTFVPVPSKPVSFEMDLQAMRSAITPDTRVILINSPNNPSGQVYSIEELQELVDIIQEKSSEYGHPIMLISDEPYRFLTYDDTVVPPVMALYPYSLVVSSYSKSLSMAGERVGYLAVHPEMPGGDELLQGLNLTNRILGFVNAPVIGQILLQKALHVTVDTEIYASRRRAMAEIMDKAGLEFSLPRGGFYFFPKAPGGDDQKFVRELFEENILAVPGSGFGYPGFVRFSFCVSEEVIRRAEPGLVRAVAGSGTP